MIALRLGNPDRAAKNSCHYGLGPVAEGVNSRQVWARVTTAQVTRKLLARAEARGVLLVPGLLPCSSLPS